MNNKLGVTQYLTNIPNLPAKEGPEPILTHVDQRLDRGIVIQSRGAGKTTLAEIEQVLIAGEKVLEAIQGGALFSTDEDSINTGVQATDNLETAIQKLRAKGF